MMGSISRFLVALIGGVLLMPSMAKAQGYSPREKEAMEFQEYGKMPKFKERKHQRTEAEEESRVKHFEANLIGGLYLADQLTWLLEPSFTWHFHKLFGVSIGMEMTSQVYEGAFPRIIDGKESDIPTDERNIKWFNFKPSLLVKTPALWESADGGCRLWMQVEPGVTFACPGNNSVTYRISAYDPVHGPVYDYRKFPNKGLRWFYWNLRASVDMAFENFTVGAGYGISDFDYYSCRRGITFPDDSKFPVPAKKPAQSIFLSVGYLF